MRLKITLVLMLLVSGCTNQTPPPKRQAQEPSVQSAVEYFFSKERQPPFQEVLDTLGVRLTSDMLAQRIPSRITAWSIAVTERPAPLTGVAMISSVPLPGKDKTKPSVRTVVTRTNGKIDWSQGVLALFIVKGDDAFGLIGRWGITSSGSLVEPSVDSFSWVHQPKGYLYVSSSDIGADLLEAENRYSGEPANYRIVDENGKTLKTNNEVREADQAFLADLSKVEVGGSDWN